MEARAGLCPLLEGRVLKLRAIRWARQRGSVLSFFLGNTLRVPPLASLKRPRTVPSGLRALRWQLVKLPPGCSLTQSRRLVPLISPHNGRSGFGVLETPFGLLREVVPQLCSRRFRGFDWVELSTSSLATYV